MRLREGLVRDGATPDASVGSDGGVTTPSSLFSEAEIAYLTTPRRLGRISTVGRDGTPHVAPVGFTLNLDDQVIEVRGRELTRSKKFKDVARTGRAAIVIDDVLPPWQTRGVEIRGRAEALEDPKPQIRIHPERIIAWGIDGESRAGRSVTTRPTREP